METLVRIQKRHYYFPFRCYLLLRLSPEQFQSATTFDLQRIFYYFLKNLQYLHQNGLHPSYKIALRDTIQRWLV